MANTGRSSCFVKELSDYVVKDVFFFLADFVQILNKVKGYLSAFLFFILLLLRCDISFSCSLMLLYIVTKDLKAQERMLFLTLHKLLI